VYGRNATGDVAPVRTISGPTTGLNRPFDVAFDPNGNLYVSNSGGSTITVYGKGASGDVTPIRTIAGPNTGLVVVTGLTF
jgi:hypothetical protein